MQRQISAVVNLFVRALRDERGGETMECSMLLGVGSVGGYSLMSGVGEKVVELWRRLDTALGAI